MADQKAVDRSQEDILKNHLKEFLDQGKEKEVSHFLDALYDVEIAEAIKDLDTEHRNTVIKLLDSQRAAYVLSYLEPEQYSTVIESLSDTILKAIINEMDIDDRIGLIEDVDDETKQRLMRLLEEDERKETEEHLSYPEDSIGRLMDTDYGAIHQNWTVEETLSYVRKCCRDAETLHTLYVVDDHTLLLDEITLREIIMSELTTPIHELMDRNVIKLRALDDREEAVRIMEKYDSPVLPVVSEAGKLVGIVTFDDVADVAEEEATEDIQKMGGSEALDLPYMSTSVLTLFRKRSIWLLILFLGQMLTITAMGAFEDQLEKAVILTIFVPLIIASGGNSGSQATSLVIRALAVGEIRLRDWWKVLNREIITGLLLGLLLGFIGLVRVMFGQSLGMDPVTDSAISVAFAVAAALIAVVLFGSLVGSMLPFILSKLGLDPATSSAPFVATIVDVTGLVIYFITAMTLLKDTVLA